MPEWIDRRIMGPRWPPVQLYKQPKTHVTFVRPDKCRR